MRELIAQGTSLDCDASGCPILHAAMARDGTVVRTLLEAGAVIDPVRSSVLLSVRSAAAARLLISHGADIAARTPTGDSVLHRAAYTQLTAPPRPDLIDCLIRAGADVNARNARGETALHTATRAWSLGVMRVLTEAGIDLEARDIDGRTALDDAYDRDRLLVAELIRDGADDDRSRWTRATQALMRPFRAGLLGLVARRAAQNTSLWVWLACCIAIGFTRRRERPALPSQPWAAASALASLAAPVVGILVWEATRVRVIQGYVISSLDWVTTPDITPVVGTAAAIWLCAWLCAVPLVDSRLRQRRQRGSRRWQWRDTIDTIVVLIGPLVVHRATLAAG